MKPNRVLSLRLWGVAMAAVLWADPACFVAGGATELEVILDRSPLPAQDYSRSTYAPVVQKVSPSVVTVLTAETVQLTPRMRPFFGRPQFEVKGLGSGVIVTRDGYILSNSHVVEDAEEIKIRLADGTEHEAIVIGTDPKTDIAVLKVSATNLSPVLLTDSDRIQVGDVVLAIGNPFGVGQTVTAGIVSGLGRNSLGITDYEDFIQTDASINPGNSGGALVDAAGRLVGIPSAIYSPVGVNMGIGFAIPINLAYNIMKQIVTRGEVIRGYLGVTIQPLTPQVARELKLSDQNGAVVRSVEDASPAQQAGVAAGDVIVEFQGTKVKDAQHFRFMVAQTSPNSTATLKVFRDRKELSLTAVLGTLGGEKSAANKIPASAQSHALQGVTVLNLDTHLREQFSVPAEMRGVLVSEVDTNSASFKAGLQPGSVILEINRQRPRDAADALELSKRIRNERTLLRVWHKEGIRYVAVAPAR